MNKKLNKNDKYAIEFLHNKNMSTNDIAKETGFSVSQVTKIINSLQPPQTQINPTVAEAKDKTKNLIIRQTSAGKKGGVAIMTEGAAQLGDELSKTSSTNSRLDKHIFRRQE